jgi:hypothetical protein
MATDEQLRAMDDAADAAIEELVEHLNEWTAMDVAKWWANWYMKAGHKRLGRRLVELAKQKSE